MLAEKNKLKRRIVKAKKEIWELSQRLLENTDVPLDICVPMMNKLNFIMNTMALIHGMESAPDEKAILEKAHKKAKRG